MYNAGLSMCIQVFVWIPVFIFLGKKYSGVRRIAGLYDNFYDELLTQHAPMSVLILELLETENYTIIFISPCLLGISFSDFILICLSVIITSNLLRQMIACHII